MSIGFDRRNLDIAVARVVQLAKEKGQDNIWLSTKPKETFVLSDPEQVRRYLIAWTENAHTKSQDLRPGQIVGVPYYSIGVVFEANLGEMHPPPLSLAPGRPDRIAMFWQVL